MKKIARYSVAAIVLASVLGVSACTSPPQTGPLEVAASESAVPKGFPNKPAGFTDSLDTSRYPDAWQSSAGWNVKGVSEKSVVSIGKYIAYNDVDANGQAAGLLVVDGEGEMVYSYKSTGNKLISRAIEKVFKGGKEYVVYSEVSEEQAGAGSVSKPKKKLAVAVVDEDGKEVAIAVNDYVEYVIGGLTMVVDPLTAKTEAVTAPEGYFYAKTVNGVHIFGLSSISSLSDPVGKLTNGQWTIDTGTKAGGANTLKSTPAPVVFGKYIQVTLPGTESEPQCALYDVTTGEKVELSSVTEPVCFSDELFSSNGDILYSEGEDNTTAGILSVSYDKFFEITDDILFDPKYLADDGGVYGISSSKFASFNILDEEEPKAADSFKETPKVVSNSGLALFSDEASKNDGVFVVKK